METEKINKQQKGTLSYAFGMFGTSIPINMFKTYAAVFYIDHLGYITTSEFSLILLIYTVIDALDNPLYGFFSDRTRSKWGRRKPWLIIGAPLLVVSFILFFNPPSGMGPNSAFAYVTLLYLLTGTLDSLINTNYGALFPEMFKDEKSRAKTNALRQVFQFLAMIISIALTPLVSKALGYSMTAIIYGLLALVVIWFMAFQAKEDPQAMTTEKPSLWITLRDILKNPLFWIYGIANATFFAALGLVQSGIPFFVKYSLQADAVSSTILLGIVLLTTILTIPVWVAILKKNRIILVWRRAIILITLSIVPLYFTKSVLSSTVFVALFGFGLAGVSVTMDIIAAKILDLDKKQHNIAREGSFSSLLGVLNKFSGLFTSLAYFLLFAVYGFVDGDNPGQQADNAARFLTVIYPICLFVICIVTSHLLKLSNEQSGEQ